MNPAIYVIAGLGGYLVYDKLGHHQAGASQPTPAQKMPFWSDWFNSGSQPQTANGAPKTDLGSISNAISDVSKFGTSVFSFFGTSGSSGNPSTTGGGGGSATDGFTDGITDDDFGSGQDW